MLTLLDTGWLALAALIAAVLFYVVLRLRGRARDKSAPPSLPGSLDAHGQPGERVPQDGRRPDSGRIVLHPPAPTRFPILLAHGYFGFVSLGAFKARQHYFRGVRVRLQGLGYDVYTARVSSLGGVEQRARQLADQIQALPAAKVNVVAHSMGGLDARFAIAHHGIAGRVASLTTIGTPHRGTPIADKATWLGELSPLRRALARMGASVDGVYDLRTHSMAAFNDRVLDVNEVQYGCVLSEMDPIRRTFNPLLCASRAYLARTAGASDGLVPISSQMWGEVILEIEANHWAQIGWASGFDAQAFYVELAEALALRGL